MSRLGRVLVTGGGGTIGSTLADQLVAAGADRDRRARQLRPRAAREPRPGPWRNGPVTVVEGDIRDRALVARADARASTSSSTRRRSGSPSAPRSRAWPSRCWSTAPSTSSRRRSAAGVRKVVAASSASVYGLADEFPTDERHHPYANDTLYGAAKTFNEGLLRSFHAMNGLDYVALRYFNVYGPRMDVHGVYTEVLVRWMERIAAGEPPLIFGDGTQTMDFVYVADIARANVLAAEADVTDAVFNVASGVETSLNELAETLLRVMGSDLPVEYGPERAVNEVPRRLADTTAARERARLRGRGRPRGRAHAAGRLVARANAPATSRAGPRARAEAS